MNLSSLPWYNLSMRKSLTLIELMVVIAIIGILGVVITPVVNKAIRKARDARRIEDFTTVSLAMELYFIDYSEYPPSPNLSGSWDDHNTDFEAVAAVLVSEELLKTIPKDPNPNTSPYMQYTYSPGSAAGSIIVAHLEAVSPTTEGPYGSCRPFDVNWCSNTLASNDFCLCHPY